MIIQQLIIINNEWAISHTFSHCKSSKFGVYFIPLAHLSSDWPHFKCSQPHRASGFHIGQSRSK